MHEAKILTKETLHELNNEYQEQMQKRNGRSLIAPNTDSYGLREAIAKVAF